MGPVEESSDEAFTSAGAPDLELERVRILGRLLLGSALLPYAEFALGSFHFGAPALIGLTGAGFVLAAACFAGFTALRTSREARRAIERFILTWAFLFFCPFVLVPLLGAVFSPLSK